MPEPSLEPLQIMVQRVLEKQLEHDDRFAQVMNRLERAERAIDDMIRRIAALEATP